MSEFIDQLKSGNDKMQVLRSFQHWMSTSEASALVKLATDEHFGALFDFLYQAGPDEVVLGSEILHKLVSVAPVSSRIPRLRPYFLSGLEHNSPKIREVILKELKICALDNSALEHLSGNTDFISRIARLVGDDNITVAASSCDFLITLGQHFETASLIMSPPVDAVLKAVMLTDDILKFRVYQVVIKIATNSPESLSLVAKNGYFDILNADMKSKDDLILMNCLEIVKDLAATDHGLKYLNDFIKVASNMIFASLEPPQSFIILPGLLKLFIGIGKLQPEYVFHNHNDVIQSLFSLLDSDDIVLLCIATDGIGLLGNSMRGKTLLQNEGKMPCALQSFRTNLQQGSPPEVKFHVIQALARLLEVEEDERNANRDFESVLEGWLKHISENPGNLLFELCRQPFLEIRHSALYLMSVVVSHEWGQRVMASVPGFVEFLLDRSSEGTVPGKELKFKIVNTLVCSSSFERIFDSDTVNKLKEYHSRGAFHVTSQSVVAVDDPM